MVNIIKTRRSVFETNSSSTHSVTVCEKSDWDKFVKGELVLWGEKLIPLTEAKRMWQEYNETFSGTNCDIRTFEEYCEFEYIKTYKEWLDNYDLETYKEDFTTSKGEEIVVFGVYGYDG
ncbi:MAG: hypothetical protein J6T10_14785 [Methanobrevibacter sp.]|nr:hypothetical protein [Methanobrevibacter sp.]